ncbi:unnamed protein product, partial [marine sediment metagenome]
HNLLISLNSPIILLIYYICLRLNNKEPKRKKTMVYNDNTNNAPCMVGVNHDLYAKVPPI